MMVRAFIARRTTLLVALGLVFALVVYAPSASAQVDAAAVAKGIQDGKGPACAGMLAVVPGQDSPTWKIRVDANGMPMAADGEKGKPASFIVRVFVVTYQSRGAPTYKGVIQITDVASNAILRIGTSSQDSPATSPADAVAQATQDMNAGVTGRFNTAGVTPSD